MIRLYLPSFLFICLFLTALGLVAARRPSLVAVNGGYSLVVGHRFLNAVASPVAEHRL